MKTVSDILGELRLQLLDRLEVFDEGYVHVRQDMKKGLLVSAGNEGRYVGINDADGDYFYIRVASATGGGAGKSSSDCSIAVKQKYSCSLVTMITGEADVFILSDALVNEIIKTRIAELKAVWLDPIAIIEQEMKGLDRKSVEASKARIGERTIVKVDFELLRNFESHNCEYKICKPCQD